LDSINDATGRRVPPRTGAGGNRNPAPQNNTGAAMNDSHSTLNEENMNDFIDPASSEDSSSNSNYSNSDVGITSHAASTNRNAIAISAVDQIRQR
jgi:hypothetical protein